MNKNQKEILSIRLLSTAFVILALAIFNPFGTGAWELQAYVALFILGIIVCMITELIIRYIIRMPHSTEHGVNYIIRRNLWFQLINTPIITLMICLYRHYVLGNYLENNKLSFSNYLETLIIIGFISYAIGIYWRFKFRSRYLKAELEETRQLNEKLKTLTSSSDTIIKTDAIENQEKKHSEVISNDIEKRNEVVLKGSTSEMINLDISNLLYIEAVGNYVKVYHMHDGEMRNDMIRATSKQMEEELIDFPKIVRCHRAFLVNLGQVEQIISKTGTMQLLIKHCHDYIPVSRSNMTHVKEIVNGLRK